MNIFIGQGDRGAIPDSADVNIFTDPWLSGDPWSVATKASPKAQEAKPLEPRPWTNFRKTATAGGKVKEGGKDSKGKGKAVDRMMEAGGKIGGNVGGGTQERLVLSTFWAVLSTFPVVLSTFRVVLSTFGVVLYYFSVGNPPDCGSLLQ